MRIPTSGVKCVRRAILNWRINRRVSLEDKALIETGAEPAWARAATSPGPLGQQRGVVAQFCAPHARTHSGEPPGARAGRRLAQRRRRKCAVAESSCATPSSSAAATTDWSAPRISPPRDSKSPCSKRRGVVGGAAVTEEFHPGFRNSVAAYTVSLLNPKVIRDLDLPRHGLRIVERKLANFLPLDESTLSESGRRTYRPRSREIFRARCRALGCLRRASRCDRRRAARSGAANAAECHRRRLARGVARTAARRAPGQADREAGSADAARAVGFIRANPPETISTLGSRARPSRRPMDSTAWSATTRVPTRQAPPTCSCTMCSARSTARKAPGDMRSAEWAPSPRRWPKRPPARGVEIRVASPVREVLVEGRTRGGRGHRKRRSDSGAQRRIELESEIAVRLADRFQRFCRRIFASASAIGAVAPEPSA